MSCQVIRVVTWVGLWKRFRLTVWEGESRVKIVRRRTRGAFPSGPYDARRLGWAIHQLRTETVG